MLVVNSGALMASSGVPWTSSYFTLLSYTAQKPKIRASEVEDLVAIQYTKVEDLTYRFGISPGKDVTIIPQTD